MSNSVYSDLTVFQLSRTNTVSNSQSFQETTAAGGLGQEVYHAVFNGLEPRKQTITLEFEDLKEGEYLVRIVNGATVFYKKLIIE